MKGFLNSRSRTSKYYPKRESSLSSQNFLNRKNKKIHLGVRYRDRGGAPSPWPGPWQPGHAAGPAPLPRRPCSHTNELFLTRHLHQIISLSDRRWKNKEMWNSDLHTRCIMRIFLNLHKHRCGLWIIVETFTTRFPLNIAHWFSLPDRKRRHGEEIN